MQLNSSTSLLSDKRIQRTVVAIGSISAAVALIKATLALIKSKNGNSSLPIIPYKYPFVGSTFEYYTNPLKLAKFYTEKWGPTFRLHLHGDLVTVVGAKDVPEVFNHSQLSFLASNSRFFNSALFNGKGEFTLPDKSVTNAIRKHLTPNLDYYSPRAFRQFLQEVDDKALEDQFILRNLRPFFRRFVAKYSASVFVGTRMCQDENLISAFEHAVADIGTEFRPGPLQVIFPRLNSIYTNYFFPKSKSIKKHRALIKASLSTEIAKRMSEESQEDCIYNKDEKKDVLDYLLKTYPHEMNNDHLETLTTVILILIFVGVHTTSEAVTYVMYCLAKHPEYISELREEQEKVLLDEGVADRDRNVIYTPAMYRQMVKLDSFIRESMRTRMVGFGLPHTNIGEEDIVLKSGAIVEPVHHDKDNQPGFQNLETFDGFRYVDMDKLAVKAGQDHLAFGMGRHACPGRWFATHQIKGIVSYFIKNYEISAKSEIGIANTTTEHHKGQPTGVVQFTKIK
ncbi:serine/threonine-protein kinase HAL4/sat4 [Mucor velutinosus]|uniref:Serine/threonine-protein kinase HAL4/sat4 n=1 Tax=Mucor velutinosus TaxID=708070 RepID=A0AAN7I4X0_9FUNG|nr:serine/threonine-protein kinase HAL4/sat4 [Mucor velutinosus]